MAGNTSDTSTMLGTTPGGDNSTTVKPTDTDGDNDLVLGAIIGAVVGVIVLLLVCIICCSRKRRRDTHRRMNPAPRRNPRLNEELARKLRAGKDRLSRLNPFTRSGHNSAGSSDSRTPIEDRTPKDPDIKQQRRTTPPIVTDLDEVVAPAKVVGKPHSYVNQAVVMGDEGAPQTQAHGYQPTSGPQEPPPKPHAQCNPQGEHSYINAPNRHAQPDLDTPIYPPPQEGTDGLKYINVGSNGEPRGIEEGDYIRTTTGSDDEDNHEYANGDFLPPPEEGAEDDDNHSYQNMQFKDDEHYENAHVAHEQKRDNGYTPHNAPLNGVPPQLKHPRPPRTQRKH